MKEMQEITKIAREYGYETATRPGRDEARYCYSTLTHIVFVEARHELYRAGREAAAWMVDEFRCELDAARDWCDRAIGDEVAKNGRIELRPLANIENARWDPQAVNVDEMVTLNAANDPEHWPVLAENPETGG